jgi:hypothetical protein
MTAADITTRQAGRRGPLKSTVHRHPPTPTFDRVTGPVIGTLCWALAFVAGGVFFLWWIPV